MRKVYVWAAHTSFSPGAMTAERNEHADVLRMAKFIVARLNVCEGIHAVLLTGNVKSVAERDALVLVLHRSFNEGNDRSYGAEIFTKKDADAKVQYAAYRLLESICRTGLFRYKGVHECTAHKGFENLNLAECENAFMITLGFIDSSRDNLILDRHISRLGDNLCEKIIEIIKEDVA